MGWEVCGPSHTHTPRAVPFLLAPLLVRQRAEVTAAAVSLLATLEVHFNVALGRVGRTQVEMFEELQLFLLDGL